MEAHNLNWRMLPVVAILLIAVALLLPACADRGADSRDLFERLSRHSH